MGRVIGSLIEYFIKARVINYFNKAVHFHQMNQNSSRNPVGTDQLLNVESTLIQRWASTFLNHPQRWYLVEKSLILKQWSTKNQPSLKLKCQSWKMVEIWLTVGWFLVELWLRSWFLVDHCFKISDFSTKYQRWYLVEKLICAHREKMCRLADPKFDSRTNEQAGSFPLISKKNINFVCRL